MCVCAPHVWRSPGLPEPKRVHGIALHQHHPAPKIQDTDTAVVTLGANPQDHDLLTLLGECMGRIYNGSAKGGGVGVGVGIRSSFAAFLPVQGKGDCRLESPFRWRTGKKVWPTPGTCTRASERADVCCRMRVCRRVGVRTWLRVGHHGDWEGALGLHVAVVAGCLRGPETAPVLSASSTVPARVGSRG